MSAKNLTKTPSDKALYDARYIKNNTTTFIVRLNNEYDKELLSHINTKPNKSGYIKQLLQSEMEKQKTALKKSEPPEE